jgi:hypothetical protein
LDDALSGMALVTAKRKVPGILSAIRNVKL